MPHPPPPPASAALAWLGCPHPPFLQLLVFALPPTACMHATRAGLCGAAVQLQPAWLPAAAVLGAAAHGGHALPASCSGAPDADHKRGKPHAGGAPFGGVRLTWTNQPMPASCAAMGCKQGLYVRGLWTLLTTLAMLVPADAVCAVHGPRGLAAAGGVQLSSRHRCALLCPLVAAFHASALRCGLLLPLLPLLPPFSFETALHVLLLPGR